MDLSHMIGLWLAGQSSGVMPGGVTVVYAPIDGSRRDAGGEGGEETQGGAAVYPFSESRLVLRGGPGAGGAWAMRAGVALVGELEYGPEGLDGFVPRLFGAVNLLDVATEKLGRAEGLAAASHAGEGEAPKGDPRLRTTQEQLDGRLDDDAQFGAGVNRGEASIGLSDKLQFVDRFDAQGVLGRARVVGFVERPRKGGRGERELVQCCDDVAAAAFPVMFETLQHYLRFQVSAQVAGNGYDDLAGALAKSDRPTHAVVVVGLAGAVETQMSDVGSPGLKAGDVCHSVVYDPGAVTPAQIEQALRVGDAGVLEREGVSWLRQEVE